MRIAACEAAMFVEGLAYGQFVESDLHTGATSEVPEYATDSQARSTYQRRSRR